MICGKNQMGRMPVSFEEVGMRFSCCLLGLAFCVAAGTLHATVLPDACGEEKGDFRVSEQKDATPPGEPEAGKAQVIFANVADRNTDRLTIRVGMDGSWVGATKGHSYFAVTVAPGVHHLCTNYQGAMGQLKEVVGLTSFTAEAGKTYYFAINAVTSGAYGNMHKTIEFAVLSEDEGKFRVKAGPMSVFELKK
jgi:hypothetical protein